MLAIKIAIISCTLTAVTMQFNPVVYTVTEAAGAVVRFHIVKLNSTTQNVTVLFSTLPGTATGKSLIYHSNISCCSL